MSISIAPKTQAESVSTETVSNNRRLHFISALAAIGSGLLMAGCFWPVNWHFLAWGAMVPWLIVLPRLGGRAVLLFGILLALVFYGIGLAWLVPLYGLISIPIVVALAVLMALAFRVARELIHRKGSRAILWAVPLTFTAQEVLRAEGLPLQRFSQ